MKRITVVLLFGLFIAFPLRAEDTTTTTAAPAPETVATAEATQTAAPADMTSPAPATTAMPTPVDAPPMVPPAPAAEPVNTENLEFISGEVSALDEATKSITVKMYGENDSTASDKTLKVTVDANTDITDGEQDRDLKSLSVGTEVDVEYDAATSKATYIFVY